MLRRGYAALSRGDLDATMADAHPDLEIVTSGAFLDRGMVYRGRDGIAQFFEMLADSFEWFEYELEDVVEVDEDRVLALLRLRARGRGSGVEVDTPLAHLWELRDEKAARMQAFAEREEAFAALGLT
jgi:ketosteroid isomerase-like protein